MTFNSRLFKGGSEHTAGWFGSAKRVGKRAIEVSGRRLNDMFGFFFLHLLVKTGENTHRLFPSKQRRSACAYLPEASPLSDV